MKRSNLGVLLAAVAALILSSVACSGDDDDGGGFSDDGGTGTQTLKITAALSVDADGSFLANVNVLDDNMPVNDATVTLRTPAEDIALVVQVPFGTYSLPAGTYDYAAGFGLEVDAGAAGHATGIGFNAPDLTQVTAPLSQTTLPVNQDLTVTWAGRGADEHRLELTVNDYDSGWVEGDTGSDVILAAMVTSAATETLTVSRRKEMDITSGFTGSLFTAELEDEIVPLGLQ